MKRAPAILCCCLCLWTHSLFPQIHTFPFRESFDTSRIPLLPYGWSTSKAKSASGDFATSASSFYSSPAAVIATDARTSQWLCSPGFSLEGKAGCTIEFYERRSSSFNAGLVLEAALDDDSLSWTRIGDTLTLVSSSSYVRRQCVLPENVQGRGLVRFRWRTLGNGTGATGTLRLDDIGISVERACDLELDPEVGLPARVEAGADAPCRFTVRNRARAGTYTWRLELFDSTVGRMAAQETFTHALLANDSLALALTYPRLAPGLHRMRCRLFCTDDEDTTNNAANFSVSAGFFLQSIIVNEIMYEPSTGQAEYIELLNRTTIPYDLQGWTVADAPPSQKNRSVLALSPGVHMVEPGSYCVVASDSNITEMMARIGALRPDVIVVSSLGLKNTGDNIILYDPAGTAIDSLRYAPSWHRAKGTNAGKSLERIHPTLPGVDARNWSTSVSREGGTPGSQNSIYTVSLPADASLVLSPNPFSPDGDGMDDFLGIAYALQSTAVTLRVRIFDSAGRLVRTLANNEQAASRGTLLWNGRDDSGARVRLGMYIIFLEALDTSGSVLRTLKETAVVAAQLH